MLMSTPSAKGCRRSGVAQVLSMMVVMPRVRAMPVIAGRSWISNDNDPGDSSRMARVRSLSTSAMPAPQHGSK